MVVDIKQIDDQQCHLRLSFLVTPDDDDVPERVKLAPPVVHESRQPVKQVLWGVLVAVVKRL